MENVMDNNSVELAAKNVAAFLYVRLQLAMRECPDSSKWGSKKIPTELGNQTFLEYIKVPLIELDAALAGTKPLPEQKASIAPLQPSRLRSQGCR